MRHNSITDLRELYTKRFSCLDNDYCGAGENITRVQQTQIRENLGFSPETWIYFYSIQDDDYILVFTEFGLFFKESEDEDYYLSWLEISNVEYEKGDLLFYIGDSYISIDCSSFEIERHNALVSIINDYIRILEQLCEKHDEFTNNNDYPKAIEQMKDILQCFDYRMPGGERLLHLCKLYVSDIINCIPEDSNKIDQSTNLESLKDFTTFFEDLSFKEYIFKEALSFSYYLKAIIEEFNGNIYNARTFIIASLNKDLGNEEREWAKSNYAAAMEELRMDESWIDFVHYFNYENRKFVLLVKDIEMNCVPTINCFQINDIPNCIRFGGSGMPILNQLYIGHPYNPELYVPYENCEESFFVDKIHEFSYLLQCLGATEITITAVEGMNIDEINSNSKNINGNVNTFKVNVNAEYDNKCTSKSGNSHQGSRVHQWTFEPTENPYIPEKDLVWYKQEPTWQRLANQRINGNLLEYHESISTSSTRFTSDSEMKDVKAGLKIIFTNINVEYKEESEHEVKESKNTTWRIDVKFRSKNDFTPTKTCTNNDNKTLSINEYSDNEKKFLEDVTFCLEDDGIISEDERRMLEFKRKRYDISNQRAEQLITISKQNLYTDEEKEYMEEIKVLMENGVISSSARRLLYHDRDSLGITPERADELENIICK